MLRLLARVVSLLAVLPFGHNIVRQVSQSGHGAYEASLAASEDGFAVAWYDTRTGHPEIYLRLLDARGHPAGSERRLTRLDTAAYEPDVAFVGRNVTVAWYERTAAGTYRPMLALWGADGERRWLKSLSTDGHTGRNPVVRVYGSRIFAAWLEYDGTGAPDVWAEWFEADGHPCAPAQRLAPASRTTWNLNAAIDQRGRAWVAFDARIGTRSDEIFLVEVGDSASRVLMMTSDDGHASKYPDVAFSGERTALTWFDERDGNREVYLFVTSGGVRHERIDDKAVRVTATPGESIGAYVAWNDSTVGLAWCDNTAGQAEIYFQTFDERAIPLRPARRVTDNRSQSLIPAIRPAGKAFALAWNEFVPGPRGLHDEDGRSEVFFSLVR
jgi:hypothetical protein